ncbi:MAG TPA: cell division protein SepF [Patescibacteria group bacterium]|nr:cell division protein SepF [Patescibacteria group bacterium]
MKIMEKIWGGLGLFETVEAEEERPRQEEPDQKNNRRTSGSNNVVSLSTVQTKSEGRDHRQVRVVVVEPASFDDAQTIADHLKLRKPVVVNLENTDSDIAKRMIDFISGTTYALNGTIQKVGHHIFLCAPSNVDVAYNTREADLDNVLPWGGR